MRQPRGNRSPEHPSIHEGCGTFSLPAACGTIRASPCPAAGTPDAQPPLVCTGGWGCVEFKWGLSVSVPVEAGKKFSTSKSAVASALEASKKIGGDDEWDPDSEIWIP